MRPINDYSLLPKPMLYSIVCYKGILFLSHMLSNLLRMVTNQLYTACLQYRKYSKTHRFQKHPLPFYFHFWLCTHLLQLFIANKYVANIKRNIFNTHFVLKYVKMYYNNLYASNKNIY